MSLIDTEKEEKKLSASDLNNAVAQQVLGWKRGHRYGNGNGEWEIDGKPPLLWSQTPRFSTSIEAAMRVIEKLRERHWCISIMNQFHKGPQWAVSFESVDGKNIIEAFAADDSLPTAICLAALKAVESKHATT